MSDRHLIQRLPNETLIEVLKHEDEALSVCFVKIISINDLQNIESVKQMKEFKNTYLHAFENSENEGSENGTSNIKIVESSVSAESVEKHIACPIEGTASVVEESNEEEDIAPLPDPAMHEIVSKRDANRKTHLVIT